MTAPSFAPGTEEFLKLYHDAMPGDFFARPLDEQRALYAGLSRVFPNPVPEGVAVRDQVIDVAGTDLTLRIYVPQLPHAGQVFCYLRGGGFVVGSLESHHSLCAELAQLTRTVVVAPDLRSCPEQPFPAPLDDSMSAVDALWEGRVGEVDECPRIVVGGDSSGGNLGAAVAAQVRDRLAEGVSNTRIAGQALICPVLDFARWYSPEASEFAEEMRYYTVAYCPTRASAEDPRASPLLAPNFGGLPPTHLMLCEHDELRVDGERYAELLSGAEVRVTVSREKGLVHAPVRGRHALPAVHDAWLRFSTACADLLAGRPVRLSATGQ